MAVQNQVPGDRCGCLSLRQFPPASPRGPTPWWSQPTLPAIHGSPAAARQPRQRPADMSTDRRGVSRLHAVRMELGTQRRGSIFLLRKADRSAATRRGDTRDTRRARVCSASPAGRAAAGRAGTMAVSAYRDVGRGRV